MRMRVLLVVIMLVVLQIITRISGANDETQARNKNRINKSTIYKTIHTRIGDIFDCVDIYKQPSLDHPLLKNHKIQLNPNLNLEEKTRTKSTIKAKYAKTELQISGGCPPGSVPIHRLKKTNNNNDTKENIPWSRGTYDQWISLDPFDQEYFYGAQAFISLYNPSIAVDQLTSSQIWVQSGEGDTLNSIEVGWAVYPKLFHDNRTRLFGKWTTDGYLSTGCFNLLCQGFVQLHSTLAFGDRFTKMSVYDGEQVGLFPLIYHDTESGNWWLVLSFGIGEDEYVGYWPNELFYELAENATSIRFGGMAAAAYNRPSPPMGNGHLPENNFLRACCMSNMKRVDKIGQILDIDEYKAYIKQNIQDRTCYDMQFFGYTQKALEVTMLFGGPGGNCSQG